MMTERAATAGSPTSPPSPFSVPPGGGTPTWPIDTLDVIKATSEQTGGLFGVVESQERKGSGPPRHVHEREDEGYYILEGEYTFFVAEEAIPAPAGTWLFCPRGLPHTFRCETDLARYVVFIVPGGFEGFFLETFGRAPEHRLPPPPEGPPDMEHLSAQAARYGVTIVGPPPDPAP
jgi:quercetin dioxygenase-like cupin family protein